MMYIALKNLRIGGTDDVIQAGTYFCDDAPYDPNSLQVIPTGEKQPGSSQVPQPILYRPGFWSNTSISTKNLLLGYAVDMVDTYHPDYEKLVRFGVIPIEKNKPVRKSKADTVEEDSEL